MPKVLKYFNINGLAESIRYILLYTDQKFEDVRYNIKTWPIQKVKDGLPYGKMPVLEENGRVLHQSLAIARYVSAGTELLPSDPWEQAVLDSVVLTIYDFDKNVGNVIQAKSPEEKEALKKKLYEESHDFYFSRFEKQLQNNNGYFGGKLSWADFILVGVIESGNFFLEAKLEIGYPTIIQLIETIHSLPRIKEYVRDRKPYEKF